MARRIVKTQEMKVRKVMLSNWLTTLFFGKKNKSKVEILPQGSEEQFTLRREICSL